MTWTWLIAVGVFSLVLLWMPIMLIATLFSGWWELSQRHPGRKPALGSKRGVGSLAFSPVFQYKRCVSYAIDDDYLHIALPPVLGVFHRPISLPWPEIRFPVGAKRVAGMTLMEIDGRRVLASRKMVERELQVREHIEAQDHHEGST